MKMLDTRKENSIRFDGSTIFFQGTEVVVVEVVGTKVSFVRGRSVFCLGVEVSFHEGSKCLGKGPECFFFRKVLRCSIGAEVVEAEVVGADVSKTLSNGAVYFRLYLYLYS